MKGESTLIYDIETKTFGKPDANKDKLKVFGGYSYLTDKYYCLTDPNDIRKIFKAHKNIVGYNHIKYDNTVLYNNNFNDIVGVNKYGDGYIKGRIDIDLLKIIRDRASAMKVNGGLLQDQLMSFSLDFVTKTLGLVDNNDGKIKDFDYDILKKEHLSSKDMKEIWTYLKRDLEVTKKLYEYLENYFESFKEFVYQEDVDNKKYLTSSLSVYVYKAICKAMGWDEEYGNGVRESFGGGYVSFPAGEYFEGNIYCLDYNSLYPHIFAQCNLFSPSSEGWNGNGKFKVKGIYNDKEMGQIERLIMEFYNRRKELKKVKDPREYTIKIIINTFYGLTANPAFKHLFNPQGAADCTRLGRQWTLLARKIFRNAGYEVLYTDTDSVYIKDIFDDKEKMLETKKKIIDEIKSNVPFPQDTFDMGIDDEITHMWFFKGGGNQDVSKEEFTSDDDDFINRHLGYMKKNYIYLAKEFDKNGNWVDSKVIYKNLGVKKKSTSTLTRKIFREYLLPKIKKEKCVKWDKEYFEKIINSLLEEDLDYATTRYKVNEVNTYKNPSQLQAQIAQKYGGGIHKLIRNNKIGVGKNNKYCTIEEFNKNGLTLRDINLNNVWSELGYFIKEEKSSGLGDWGI